MDISQLAAQQQYNSQFQAYNNQASQDNFKYFFDSTALLDKIKHILKGEEETEQIVDVDGQDVAVKVWKPRVDDFGKPLPPPMNNKGYNYTVMAISFLLDKIISGSNFDEVKAADYIEENIKQITITYYENFHPPNNNFGFNSISEINTIVVGLCTLIQGQIGMAVNGDAKDKLISQVSIIENRLLEKSNKPQAPQPQLSF